MRTKQYLKIIKKKTLVIYLGLMQTLEKIIQENRFWYRIKSNTGKFDLKQQRC